MKKCSLILLVFLLTLVSLHAQMTKRDVLTKSLTLNTLEANLISKNDWKPFPKTPDEWKQKLPQKLIDIHIKEAEALSNYQFNTVQGTIMMDFMRSGDRIRHSDIHFDKRRNLMSLVLAESMEGKGRFVEQIFNGVWSICEESYWGVPAHVRGTGLPDVENPFVDLFSAETATCLSLTDFFIGEELDKINPLIRKRIYAETNERIFNQMINKSQDYTYMSKTRPVNNWNPWIMSNYITAALLLENNEERRVKMVHHALEGTDIYLNWLGEDGGCDEGPSYWFAAGACVFDCLDILYSAAPNAPNIYDNPFIQKMASYVYKTHIAGNYFTNFADADPTVKADGTVLYRFGKAINDQTLSQFGVYVFKDLYKDDYDNPAVSVATHHQVRKVKNLLVFDELAKQKSNYNPLENTWINDIELMLTRTKNDVVLAAHGGHNGESHNHNDVGDFVIYKNGEPLIVDAGRGNYTARTFSPQRYELWFTQSKYHNLPIINGYGQHEGKEFGSKNITYINNEFETSMSLDLAKSYPKEAGVSTWNRKIELNKKKNTVEIVESYNLTNAKELQQVFMTVANADISEKGKIKIKASEEAKLTINYDAKLWTVSIEEPTTEGMEYSSFKTKWGGKQVQRIILTNNDPKIKGKHNFTINF